MANVTWVSDRTYPSQAQTYSPAHNAGDLLLACVVTAAGVQPDLVSTGGSSAPWKTVLQASRINGSAGNAGDRYMTIKYKIANAAVGDWTETISTGGTGGTGLASTVIRFIDAKGIGGFASSISGTGANDLYAWNGPTIQMKKTDSSSVVVYFSSGYSGWGVNLLGSTGTSRASSQTIAYNYQNTGSGAAASWAQSGGAPFAWAINAAVEITNTGAASGFFNMF